MRKLKSFLCLILLLSVYANATAVRGTLLNATAQPLLGGTLELQLSSTDINGNRVVGCAGGTAPVVQGGGVIVTQIVTFRAGTGGVIINTIIGNDQINCGAGVGVGTYYHVIARNAQTGIEWTRDYAIKGGTWTPEQTPLNILPPSALPITVVVNPSGNQIIVQPGGTRFEVQGTMVGNLTGNATTATTAATAATANAFAVNAANCTLGSSAGGVDVTGAAEDCALLPLNTSSTTNQFFTAYNSTTGAFTKAQPTFANLSGSATDAQVPDNITITLAATATALSADPADCAGNNFALGIIASGVATCAQPSFTNLSGTATKAQQHTATVYNDQANTFGLFLQKFRSGANFQIADLTDATKLVQFDVSNIATGTTRTVNIPNANSTTIQSSSAGANQFATAVSAQGVVTYTQPAFTNLTGSATLAQGGTTVSTAPDDNLLVGNSGSTAFALVALPNCIDSGGNHLNYTTATNAFSCGTTGGIGGGATTALDNLAAVAINTSLLPGTAGTVNLGSGTKPFAEIFLAGTSGTPGTNNFKITGASTSGTRVVTLADGASMTVIADTGAANNFLTAISATGVISKAQPTYTNIGTGTVSGATLDAEAGSNVLKFPRKFSFRFADCDTAGNGVFMGTPGATAPTATCVIGTNVRKGVMNFSAAGTNTLQIHFPLPADFTGTADLRLFWYSPSTTGSVTWVVEAVCTATSGSTDDPAFSSFWAPSASAPAGTTNQVVTVTAAAVSWPGSCTAGTLAHLNFKRTDTTGAAVANLDSFEITQRRQ
jgi:hypothetical protein